ncbi:STY0301 family protein [Massilia genomosp. 1]|uniref:Uncharacterized protein n=1 Tax=Massilia genomosp. 1 TaxID=2609280 RepID=A0ABX0MVM0_9BURK|nr:STY0301 family protein [Massilia genomosp. 1]NHZ64098.1 hypothetical protein [Massilia genomosp. 1]
MKTLLLTAMILSSAAHAVEVKCPDVYPPKTLTLAPDSSDPEGHGLMKRAHLSYTYMQEGELYSEQTLVPPAPVKVKGGWKTEFGLATEMDNWLVCVYGGETWGVGRLERWQRIDRTLTTCILHVKQTKVRQNPYIWTAWAVCK